MLCYLKPRLGKCARVIVEQRKEVLNYSRSVSSSTFFASVGLNTPFSWPLGHNLKGGA